MPIDEKRLEKVTFFNPAQSRGKRLKFDAVPMWRGDHSQCAPGHHDRVCVSAQAWILNGNTLRAEPHIVPISIEDRAMGMVEYPGQKGKYPEPVHMAKGMRKGEEAVGVRPSPEVLQFVIDRGIRAQKATLENRGARYEEVEKQLAIFREKAQAANASDAEPPKERKRG